MDPRWSDLGSPTQPGYYELNNGWIVEVTQADIDRFKVVGGDPILELLPRMSSDNKSHYAIKPME